MPHPVAISRPPKFCRRPFCLLALLLGWGAVVAPASAEDDLAGMLLLQPGLQAEYSFTPGETNPHRGDGAKRTFTRGETSMALRLAPGDVPDSRIWPGDRWRARWSGAIQIVEPGNYRFSAKANGLLLLKIGGREALRIGDDTLNHAEVQPGEPIELAFGLHALELEFEPAAPGAELKLYWQSEHFTREPLSSRWIGHPAPETEVEARAGAPIAPDALLADDLYLRGRLTVEEHGCVACHNRWLIDKNDHRAAIGEDLLTRPGPKLSAPGKRLKAAWIYHWLDDPQKLRPEAVMPRMFANDRRGEVLRYAVAQFLTGALDERDAAPDARASSAEAAPIEQDPQASQGKLLFERIGCVACHHSAPGRPARATLLGMSQKTTAACVAEFLQDPSAIDPAGRMPNMGLSPEEAQALAAYITHPSTGAIAPLELPPPPSASEIHLALLGGGYTARQVDAMSKPQRLQLLARNTLFNHNCMACHEIDDPGNVEYPKSKWSPRAWGIIPLSEKVAASETLQGCLGSDPLQPRGQARYGETLDRQAARHFLAAAYQSSRALAPTEKVRLTLQRFNCQACHERDGIGGLAPEFVRLIAANQTPEEAELVKPPTLTGVTEKLRPKVLEEVLVGDRRARPWMSVRMPRFGKEHIGHLPSALAALEGTSAAETGKPPADDPQLAEAGRQLVGAKGFGCTKCHDLLGRASGGTRGPDLAQVAERIQYDWFERWMTDPQRIEPGTRMPTVFLRGESPYPHILDGAPDQQRAAIWHYLAAAGDLGLPDGFDAIDSPKAPDDERVLVSRTFLPGLSPRSLAIRFPSQVHLAFDAQTCRLAHAWQGEFLDMAPVWTERGGRPAHFGGPLRWTAPPGSPWDISAIDEASLPGFRGREKDTSWGAVALGDSRLLPRRVHFRGYRVDADAPVMRYDQDLPDGGKASFIERLSTARAETHAGLTRELEIATPQPALVTLLVADLAAPPQPFRADLAKAASPPAWNADQKFPAETIWLADEQAGAAIYRLTEGADAVRWRVAERDGRYHLCLQIPTSAPSPAAQPEAESRGAAARVHFALEVLLPCEDSAATERALQSIRQRETR